MILNRKLSPFRQSHSMSNGSEEIKGHAFVARGGEIARRGGPSLTGALPLVILLLFAILPYSSVLRNDFTYAYDDKAQIIDNPYAHSFQHWREVLTSNVWSHKGARGKTNYYRPLMTIGFSLCYWMFGPSAYGFHLASLLLHAAVVLVLFLMAGRLLRDPVAAFLAAGLFALHPVHVESVAWISAVTDIEVTLFCLLTFWCFLRLEGLNSGRQLFMLGAMAASFTLAILSKEQALTLPVLALVYEHFYRADRHQTTPVRKISRYAPLWLLSIGYLYMRVRWLGQVARSTAIHTLTPLQTVLSALALVGEYIGKLLFPVRLYAFYVFHPSTRLLDAGVLAGAGALILGTVSFAILWKRARPATFGFLWLFVTLAPVLNAPWMGAYVLAERYLYLPSVGFCVVAGWAGAAVWAKVAKEPTRERTAVLAIACVIAALCALRIATRLPVWRDDATLLSQAAAVNPQDYRLREGLGLAYWIRGNAEAAEREWRAALHLEPKDAQILYELGVLYAQQRRFDEARSLLESSIEMDPADSDAHLNLGAVYAETGKTDLAEEQFRAAITLTPLNFNSHNVLGKLYFDAGRLREAEQQFRQSLECEPNLAALDFLGYIYQRQRDSGRAEKAFQAALAFNGADSHAHYNLGLIYAATGRTAQAIQELDAARAADPGNPEIQSALEKLRR
jgi:Flp pilus assembly protein TadD/4-amino-4-deoxy-L-arabinose transferase-like glycosyltransferase